MFSIVTSFACSDSRSFSASRVKSIVIGWPVKREFAMTRCSAPSSSRNVGANAFRDEEGDFLGQRDASGLRLADEDRHARLELRRLDRHRESPAEARFQALFEAVDFLRITIAREDDVMLAFQQRVERVEELFLRTILVREELNVVDQERIERAIRLF